MTREELENIDTIRELTSDSDVLDSLLLWVPMSYINEFVIDYINDYDLEMYIDDD